MGGVLPDLDRRPKPSGWVTNGRRCLIQHVETDDFGRWTGPGGMDRQGDKARLTTALGRCFTNRMIGRRLKMENGFTRHWIDRREQGGPLAD